jgi:hypothetical protein
MSMIQYETAKGMAGPKIKFLISKESDYKNTFQFAKALSLKKGAL